MIIGNWIPSVNKDMATIYHCAIHCKECDVHSDLYLAERQSTSARCNVAICNVLIEMDKLDCTHAQSEFERRAEDLLLSLM